MFRQNRQDFFEENGLMHLFSEKLSKHDTTNSKKESLIILAKAGKPRPKKRKSKLGQALCNYTCPSSTIFDSVFNKKIRELRPDWFTSKEDIVNEKKALIVEMAKGGEPRPNQRKHPLGKVLSHYLENDPKFAKLLRNLRPDWFITISDKANQKKNELIKIAKQKASRPIVGKNPLGTALVSYTNPKNPCYDSAFDKKIRKIIPEWFVNSKTIKNEILKLAYKKAPRPSSGKSKLGKALIRYTTKGPCYDEKFTKKLHKLVPEWFLDVKIEMYKKQLIKMAKGNKEKPTHRSCELGRYFNCFINPKHKYYDKSFILNIKKLNKNWLISRYDIANQKKKQLIKLAKSGAPKPRQRKDPLGNALSSYISPTSCCYDLVFKETIKKIRSEWIND